MCAVFAFWLYRSVVAIEYKLRGSFTVEATVIVSFLSLLIAFVVMLGFYGHDRAVAKSTANELAMKASLWGSRYVLSGINEVDYEAMKADESIDICDVESIGYEWLQKRLFIGKVKSVQIFQGILNRNVEVEIYIDFKLWRSMFSQKFRADAVWIDSKELPRINKETGEER